jgi:hypothetical protein
MERTIIKRENFISCRTTKTEKEALLKMASLENRKPSEMMRELIREGLKNRGLDMPRITNNTVFIQGKGI